MREVNVLHAQLQGLADPNAGAVQQPCQEGMLSLHPRQDEHHLVSTQHDWQAPTNTWTLQLRLPSQAHLQHLAVQEYQRRQGLLVSKRCQLSLVGKPMQVMKPRIDSPEERRRYSQRLGTVEPVFGNLRHNKRLNRFTLRGLNKVGTQWRLFCLVHNIEKLARCALQ